MYPVRTGREGRGEGERKLTFVRWKVRGEETKSLIHRAIKLGWIRRSPAPELKTESYLRRETRAKWHARGLNSHGHPRRNKPHPELANLDRKTYHREYMRTWRHKISRA